MLSTIKLFEKVPVRFNVAVMLFMACFTAYMIRTNISIVMIPMIKENDTNNTSSSSSSNDYGPRYTWSKKDQSMILGGFFYGYLATSLIGGVLSEKFGGRNVVGCSLFFSGIITFVSPFFAQDSFWPIFLTRLMLGVIGGVIYPGLHCLVAKWAPPNEKGKFVSALLGGLAGTVVTWSMLGFIIENFGWKYGFYVPAVFAIFITFLWFLLVANSPEDHPRITKEERDYIHKQLGDTISKEKNILPVCSVLASIPFLALMILHYGSLWGLYFLMNAAPTFMFQALDFNLSKAGILSALPPLARLLAGFAFGAVGDYIRDKNIFHVTTIRKSFCLFSHIIPGLLLLSITLLAFNKYLIVAVITLSLGFNGSAVMTNLQNSQDLAPNFAGSLYGIINFVGTTSGFITPLIVAYFTEHGHSILEWQYVFWVGAAAYIAPAFIFFIFGDGKVQKWNDYKKNDTIDTKL
ncbi:hypothetical protein PVAND_008099 [Polypedilum vanderplanki]|uniref:Major facilitator superfamily (MFS) profile domain-containing protein n=1 Tax=Polypedilum vanderplanki TaxID=319348 RepID=A0A9J6C8N9_POLVA|nr:hypothetical protein PVAND_008099 [Polypedilum vanderplanki]